MASQLYPLGKELILSGGLDLTTDTIKWLIIDTADETYNSADQYHSDVTGAGIVATSGALSGKTVTSGVFDASDILISAVSGDSSEALILWMDTTVSGTSPLIAWFDISTFTPGGSDVTIVHNASGIFGI
jgi:hypothetical protein